MMKTVKRITALLLLVAVVLSFTACGENTELFKSGEPLEAQSLSTYIAKEVAAKYEMESVFTYGGKEYKTFEYNGKKALARIEKSGNVLLMFEYPLDMKIEYLTEASKRSGGYLYFTKQDSGANYASLCAIYLPTNTQMTVVDTPCSEMVLFDVGETSDLYKFGVIVKASQLVVLDLTKASAGEYSKTPAEIATFIDIGDSFFKLGNFGSYTESTVEAIDRKHVMVNIIEKNSKGETKSEINFTYNVLNGVASF